MNDPVPIPTKGPGGPEVCLQAKVCTVSDGVVAGTREDLSGAAVAERLFRQGYEVTERRVVADGIESVAAAIAEMASGFAGLIVTTGGTGFGPRDLTPEGTSQVLDRTAPGLAEAMRLTSPLGRLSRAAAGTLATSLVLNLPGSTSGALECLEAVLDVVPHALALLRGERPH
ncbi:MAG: MogA/MoaB family molybdenum cofactor biosynthesis protein [Acidimicrobiales bacterium]|jgi:molybdenum cofactor synthesis domain-containing protein